VKEWLYVAIVVPWVIFKDWQVIVEHVCIFISFKAMSAAVH